MFVIYKLVDLLLELLYLNIIVLIYMTLIMQIQIIIFIN